MTVREKILYDALTNITWGLGDGRTGYVNPKELQQEARRGLREFDEALRRGA